MCYDLWPTGDCFRLQIVWVLIEDKVWVKMDSRYHKLDQYSTNIRPIYWTNREMDPRYHIYIGPIGWCSDHYWCDGWPVETYQKEVHDWYIDILIDKLVNWYIDIWYTDILSIIYIGPIGRCSDGWPVETYQTEVHDWYIDWYIEILKYWYIDW